MKGNVGENLGNVLEQIAEAGGEVEVHPSEFNPVLVKSDENTLPWRQSLAAASRGPGATRTPRPS